MGLYGGRIGSEMGRKDKALWGKVKTLLTVGKLLFQAVETPD